MATNYEVAIHIMEAMDDLCEDNIDGFQSHINDIINQKLEILGTEYELYEDELQTEATIITKVNFKGERRKKKVCGPGMILKGNACVPQSSTQKLAIKKGHRKATKTKRALGAGKQAITNRKRNKARTKRKQQGL